MSDSKNIVTDLPTKTIPIMEFFGPTIQGEGIMTGTVSHFLRTGGCPLRCSWCDSMFAVLPSEVKAKGSRLTISEILDAFDSLPWAPYVTLTGGDPCMHKGLGDLIPAINGVGTKVAVETQGTLFPGWLSEVDIVTFSPKPPSSDNIVEFKPILDWILNEKKPHQKVCIKVVVGTEADLQYALEAYAIFPENIIDGFYFTSLTTFNQAAEGSTHIESAMRLLGTVGDYQNLSEHMLEQAKAGMEFHAKTFVGCQQHVILWPAEDTGV